MDSLESLSMELAELLEQKEQMEKKEKELRKNVHSLMVKTGVTEYDNGNITIKAKKGYCRNFIDLKLIEKYYPETYFDERVWKQSQISSYVLIRRKKVKR